MKLLFAVLVVLLSGCVARVSENALVKGRPGERIDPAVSQSGSWKIDPVSIQLESDVSLSGARFSKPNSIATVLYFGGNAFVLSKSNESVLSTYKEQPVDLVMLDYRGYGGSTGIASLDAILADGVLIYDYVRAMPSIADKPLVVHSQSLGSFVAGNVASQRTLSALVLESSATTAEDWVQGFVDSSIWIRKGIVQSTLKGKGNASAMASFDEPLLIVVGKDDTTTRPVMSEALFKQASVPASWKELLFVSGAGHDDAAKGVDFNSAFSRLLDRAQK